MLRSAIAACAVALSLSAHADSQGAPFSPDDSGTTKVLKLIRWIGTIGDLSGATETLPDALGLHVDPTPRYVNRDGAKTRTGTDYLSLTPIWTGAHSEISYTVAEADDPANRNGRAWISLRLAKSEACVRFPDLVSYFGEPTLTYPAEVRSTMTPNNPWAPGRVARWAVREAPWKTEIITEFRPRNDNCAEVVSISQAQ
jgi:hypothetical protein